MEWSAIADIIQSVGFPVAVCIACFWYINKQDTGMKEALNNNTLVMQKLVDKMEELTHEKLA